MLHLLKIIYVCLVQILQNYSAVKRSNIWEQREILILPVRWRPHYNLLRLMEDLMCKSTSVGYKTNRKNIQRNM